ncbi:transposase family protein, partial [Streptomyces sp. NPDC055722]
GALRLRGLGDGSGAAQPSDHSERRPVTGKGSLPDHPRLSGDGGYRGSDRIRTPRRGTDGRIVKDWNYRRFRKRRAVAEHTIARLKDHQILRQCRRRGDAINHAVAGVAALHNLKLDIR